MLTKWMDHYFLEVASQLTKMANPSLMVCLGFNDWKAKKDDLVQQIERFQNLPATTVWFCIPDDSGRDDRRSNRVEAVCDALRETNAHTINLDYSGAEASTEAWYRGCQWDQYHFTSRDLVSLVEKQTEQLATCLRPTSSCLVLVDSSWTSHDYSVVPISEQL